jgi:hypothetical protein
MATVLSQVLDRLDVLLRANVPVGCSVFRERTEAESRAEAPCVNVSPRDATVESFSREMDKHQVSIEMRIHVRADTPTPAAEVVHAAFHGVMTDDAALQTLVESVRLEAASFAEVEADVTALDKSVRYRFTYLIPKNTL